MSEDLVRLKGTSKATNAFQYPTLNKIILDSHKWKQDKPKLT
jgi:hypothetical protein